jgi:hypothetical protein
LYRPSTLLAPLLCLIACSSSPEIATSDAGETAARNAVWQFDFVDTEQRSRGYLLLAFTDELVDQPTCGNDYWKKIVVLDDGLDFDLSVEPRPAYTVNGPWLTMDLTASVCYLDHKLIGDITPDGASGFFNFSHQLGGYNIGKFTANQPESGVVPP